MASGDIRKWFMKQPAKNAPAAAAAPVSFAFSRLWSWFLGFRGSSAVACT